MRTRLLLIAALLTTAATGLSADNWPHWRGPSRDGVSTETNLPLKWTTDENIAWKLAMPAWSGSTPIIWGERIFLNVADGSDLWLWSVDRAKGDVLWKKHLSGGDHRERKQNMSSPSPVTDGRHVWVMTGTGIFKAFDFDGNEIWMRDIQADYGKFGFNESPDAYTTPALLRYDGKTEIVITGGDVVTGHDHETGQELWRADGLNPQNDPNHRIVASPIVHGEMIYAPTRVRPLLALKAGGRGDVTESHRAWSFDRGPDVPTPVTDGRYFYVVDDRGIVHCLDAKTGAVVYGPERLRPGTYSASPLLADGNIYVTNEDGLTSVFKAGPAFGILAENAMNDYCLSSIAVSEGQLFLRTTGFLYAIGQRRK